MSISKVPVVWIIDDDEDDQYLFEVAFKQLISTVSIKLLSDGEDLLPALDQSSLLPDLIILDLNMRRQNGFQTLKKLRSIAVYEKLPVVVLTTSSQREDQQLAMELGANDFLTKPPSMDIILALFRQLLADWNLVE